MHGKLGHIVGASSTDVRFLPKFAKCTLTESEKLALADELGEASNLAKLDLAGTHYEDYDPDQIELLMGW